MSKPDVIKAALAPNPKLLSAQETIDELCRKLVAEGIVTIEIKHNVGILCEDEGCPVDTNVYEIEVWNRTIDAVLKLKRVDEYAAIDIRKLKR